MKKILLSGAALTLGVTASLTTSVFAQDYWNISNEADLVACLTQAATSTCTLGSDVTTTGLINIVGDKTLNLGTWNSHTITNINPVGKVFEVKGSSFTITGRGTIHGNTEVSDANDTGAIRIYGVDTKESGSTHVTIDKNVKIEGPHAVVVFNNNGTAYNTTLDFYGTINSTRSGIWTIGTIGDQTNYPVINIHDGATIAPLAGAKDDYSGLAGMAYAEYNLGKANIKGIGQGLGIKAGKWNINGTTVVATGEDTTPVEGYTNGINASGAAIQIEANNGYAGNVELNINDGSFTSEKGFTFYEYLDTRVANPATSTAVKSISIKDGTFKAATGKPVFKVSEQFATANTDFVEGGTFSTAPDTATIPEGYGVDYVGGVYKVKKYVDLTALKSAISAAEGKENTYWTVLSPLTIMDRYSDGSWNDLQNTLTEAKNLVTLTEGKFVEFQDMVDGMTNKLNGAANGLVDITELYNPIIAADWAVALGALNNVTEASAADFTEALTAAKATRDNADLKGEGGRQAVQSAYDNLVKAADDLDEKADKTVLQNTVDSVASHLCTEEIAPDSCIMLEDHPVLNDAYNHALDVLSQDIGEKEESTEHTIANANAALQDAITKQLANTEAAARARAAISDFASRKPADYTAASYGAAADANKELDNFILAHMGDDTSAIDFTEALDERTEALREALRELVDAADTAALKDAIAEASTLDEAAYTEESFAAVKEALADAEEILAGDPSIDYQEIVDGATQALRDAIEALAKKPAAPETPETGAAATEAASAKNHVAAFVTCVFSGIALALGSLFAKIKSRKNR